MGAEVKPITLVVREFLIDQIATNRSLDADMIETIGKKEFYKRESKYCKIEKFIFYSLDENVKITDIRDVLLKNGIDLDLVSEFTLESIAMSRSIDEAMASAVSMSKTEFYQRENKYCIIEYFIFHLK
jgi:post-segregation antitoxin (ccd killing protein)